MFAGTQDFPGGVGNIRKDPEAFARLVHDVETKIFDALPDETWVYPGHGTRSARSARTCRSGAHGAGELPSVVRQLVRQRAKWRAPARARPV